MWNVLTLYLNNMCRINIKTFEKKRKKKNDTNHQPAGFANIGHVCSFWIMICFMGQCILLPNFMPIYLLFLKSNDAKAFILRRGHGLRLNIRYKDFRNSKGKATGPGGGTPCLWVVGRLRVADYIFAQNCEKRGFKFYIFPKITKKGSKTAKFS